MVCPLALSGYETSAPRRWRMSSSSTPVEMHWVCLTSAPMAYVPLKSAFTTAQFIHLVVGSSLTVSVTEPSRRTSRRSSGPIRQNAHRAQLAESILLRRATIVRVGTSTLIIVKGPNLPPLRSASSREKSASGWPVNCPRCATAAGAAAADAPWLGGVCAAAAAAPSARTAAASRAKVCFIPHLLHAAPPLRHAARRARGALTHPPSRASCCGNRARPCVPARSEKPPDGLCRRRGSWRRTCGPPPAGRTPRYGAYRHR